MPFLPARVRAALWMMVSGVAFAGLWVLVRLAAEELHPFALAAWSYGLGLLWLLPVWLAAPGIVTRRALRQNLRPTFATLVATFAAFIALATAPLGRVLAIQYLAPWFATVIGVVLWRRPADRPRLIALGIGLAGGILVLLPGTLPLTTGILAALAAALALSAVFLAGEARARRATDPGANDPRARVLAAFLVATPVALLLALPWWGVPQAHLWPILFAIGACMAAAHLGLENALALADPTTLLPFEFVRFFLVLFAAAHLFRQHYTNEVVLGGAILILAGPLLLARDHAR